MNYNDVSEQDISLAGQLEKLVSGCTSDRKAQAIAKAFIVDAHRTNKQSMARLINALLEEYENDSYDARNDASVLFAQSLTEGREVFNKLHHLPYI